MCTVLIYYPSVSVCVDSLLSVVTDCLDCLEIVQIQEVEAANLLVHVWGVSVLTVLGYVIGSLKVWH